MTNEEAKNKISNFHTISNFRKKVTFNMQVFKAEETFNTKKNQKSRSTKHQVQIQIVQKIVTISSCLFVMCMNQCLPF